MFAARRASKKANRKMACLQHEDGTLLHAPALVVHEMVSIDAEALVPLDTHLCFLRGNEAQQPEDARSESPTPID